MSKKVKKYKRTIATLNTGIVKVATAYNEKQYESFTKLKQEYKMANPKGIKFALAFTDSVLKNKKVPTKSEIETISNSIVSRSKEPSNRESISLMSEAAVLLKKVFANGDRSYASSFLRKETGHILTKYRNYSKK